MKILPLKMMILPLKIMILPLKIMILQDELGAGETWEDPEYDSPGARGDHHLAVPTTKLHYMLKTAASLEALPMVDLDPELREPPAAVDLSPKPQDLVSQMDFQCGAAADESGPTVTSLQITVHCMRNIPETVARPVCRVYISSPPAGTQFISAIYTRGCF